MGRSPEGLAQLIARMVLGEIPTLYWTRTRGGQGGYGGCPRMTCSGWCAVFFRLAALSGRNMQEPFSNHQHEPEGR